MNTNYYSIEDNEYVILRNGRARNQDITPIKLPVKDETLPAGKFQGCYAYGTSVLVLINGQAYWKDFSKSKPYFRQITALEALSSSVDTIYAESVPASKINVGRKSSSTSVSDPVTLFDSVTGTPQSIVLQDGVSQPRLIISENVCRLAGNFTNWKYEKPEYVPVGKQMLWHDNKLYIVSPDGREIYSSVSGRPLDFVIAIDANGNKLTDGDYAVEASRLSNRVSYDSITCLAKLNIQDTSPPFLAATSKGCYTVQPDKNNLIYGEPTFTNTELFSVGINNQNSFVNILADYGFISASGIHSFNAVNSFKFEGKNAPLFQRVYKLFSEIVQDTSAAIVYDNYVLCAVKTVYGYGVLVFDTLIQQFVALDIYPELSNAPIKQFCSLIYNGEERLFFITATGFYEAFVGNTAECGLYLREWVQPDTKKEQKLGRVNLVFSDVYEDGTVLVTEYADQKQGTTMSKRVTKQLDIPVGNLSFPLGDTSNKRMTNIVFTFEQAKRCRTFGLYLSWNFDSRLQSVQVVPERIFDDSAPFYQQADIYANS